MRGAPVREMSEEGGRNALERAPPPMREREGAVEYTVDTSDTRDDAS